MQQRGPIPVHVPERPAPAGDVSGGGMPSLVLFPYRGDTGERTDGHEHVCGCCGGKAMFTGPRTAGRCPHASLCARCRSVSWRSEACSRCGMDDLPVTGPEAERLCPYCDELRTLAPLAGEGVLVRSRRRRAVSRKAVVRMVLAMSAVCALAPYVPLKVAAIVMTSALLLAIERKRRR